MRGPWFRSTIPRWTTPSRWTSYQFAVYSGRFLWIAVWQYPDAARRMSLPLRRRGGPANSRCSPGRLIMACSARADHHGDRLRQIARNRLAANAGSRDPLDDMPIERGVSGRIGQFAAGNGPARVEPDPNSHFVVRSTQLVVFGKP